MSPDTAPPSVPPVVPEKKEGSPTPPRVLRIKSEYPSALYEAIENQIGRKSSTGMDVGFVGETVGFIEVDNQNNPIKKIESRIHGNLTHTQIEEIPEQSGRFRGIGEPSKEFDIETRFTLPNHTYLDENRTAQLMANLQAVGYQSRLTESDNGYRTLVIQTPEGTFDFKIGWVSADRAVQWRKQQEEYYKQKYPDQLGYAKRATEQVLQGNDSSQVSVGITSSHPGHAPLGIPLQSREQVVQYLERSRDLTEVIATSLVNVLGEGKRFPELKMDWLPPMVVEQMRMLKSTSVVGKVEPAAIIETKVVEDFGLERLAGLSKDTLAELERIRDRLKDPKRAAFMKRHGFKQSNGAVFWGVPGTGKTLAGEALAEEAGCDRVVLKVDEYMTAYIHDSPHRLGERIREIKSQAANSNKPVIVQIDEADTILMPVNGSNISSRDAAEVRAVLLREFQEPSNVFYILTTNLDPRDPRQADPAIVRNQRVGQLVAFGLPSEQGRQEILIKEANKRVGEDLKWEGIDFLNLGRLTEGFSPADIQEMLSIAAESSYDPATGAAFVQQEDMKRAVEVIKSRKLAEVSIRPIGFRPLH